MSMTLRMMKLPTPLYDQRRGDGAELHHEVRVGAADVLDVEHAGQQRADDAADAVHAEGVERVVVAEHAA